MRPIAGIKTKNQVDALKYAYAFMQSAQLNIKECSFLNPNPAKFDGKHIFPRDMYSASYNEKDIPTWEDFKTNPVHLSSVGFSCVASLDKKDQKRVTLILLKDMLGFNCYGDYEEEAKKAFENIVSIHSSLK